MRRSRAPTVVMLLALLAWRADDATLLVEALDSISASDAMASVNYLTSNECAGRNTPQPGLRRACEFVAERFREYGLEPFGSTPDSYFFDYPITVIDPTDDTSLLVVGDQIEDVEGVLRQDFMPAALSATGVAEGKLVFAGYGIKERKYRWDSYRKVDARGKVVLVLTREPRADSDNAKFFDGTEMTAVSSLREKARIAADRGAVGLLVCAATEAESQLWMNSQHPRAGRSGGRGRGRGGRPGGGLAVPTAIITPALAERILGAKPAELRDAIDESRKPVTFALDAVRVRLEVVLEERESTCQNVIARYPGSDAELHGTVVIVGAHVDHVGVDDRGRIYPGADDNAAGVAGVLEVAQAFASARPPTRRSVVFIAFTGEERGLLGATAYTRDPPIAMANTYGMICMDIIARGRKSAIEATPPPNASFFDGLIRKAVSLSDCGLKVGNGGKEFFQQSDHYAFHEKGVPTVFVNEGTASKDLHRPTDTADKVLENKVERVAKFVFALAYLAANSDLKGGLK